MKTNIKRVAAALCSCTLLAAGLTACGSTEAESVMDPTVTVQVQNVRRGSIELQGTYVGSVSAAESVNVIPLVQGATVESVNVAVGSEVKQGQVLAKLDSTSADLTAKNAQAAYNSALAQAQSALGGQWKTNIYSAERGIDQLDDNIDNMNDQIDKLEDKKDDLEKARNAAKANSDTISGAAASYVQLLEGFTVSMTDANKDMEPIKTVGADITYDKGKAPADKDTYINLGKIANLGAEKSGMKEDVRKNVISVSSYLQTGGKLTDLTNAETIKAAAEAYQSAESVVARRKA